MAWSLFDQSAVSPLAWAQEQLQSLGVPLTTANEQSLIAWALLEGGGGTYNPLNTSLPEPGSTTFNSYGVQNYTDWAEGITADTSTINEAAYTQIKSDLTAGTGIGATPELDTWSGNGYGSLSATWGEAGQYMSGKTASLPAANSGKGSGVSFDILDPTTWGPAIADSIIGSTFGKDITDLMERGALIIFGAVLLIIGIIRLTESGKGEQIKATLAAPVTGDIPEAAEAA